MTPDNGAYYYAAYVAAAAIYGAYALALWARLRRARERGAGSGERGARRA
jgi:hypothetical protein